MATHFNLPEELIERILAQTVPAQPNPCPRLQWLRSPTRLAPLCVSRQFNRIATPLLYHTVNLSNEHAARLLRRTLHDDRPQHAQLIRVLVVLGVWAPVCDVLRVCLSLASLDLTIAFDDDDGTDFDVFSRLTSLRHLTLRKPSNVYLSLRRPRALIVAIAHAIPMWSHLRTANIAFKLSDDAPTSPINHVHPFALPPSAPSNFGPITALATALAASPALHTFSTYLPSVWNTSIAHIASNPALDRIALSPPSSPTAPIPGTGLFLMEARRHPRLIELIAAGTPIIRSRAHTLGTSLPSPAPTPQKTGVGLGLRIDTSVEAIGGEKIVCQSPASQSAVGAINPAWMGPLRKVPVRSRTRG